MSSNWFEVARKQLQEYPSWLPEVGICAFFGFIVGFLFKNFSRFIFFGVVALILGLVILQYFNIVSINTVQIKDILGLSSVHTIDDALRLYSDWAREHTAGLLAVLVSFGIGWKVG